MNETEVKLRLSRELSTRENGVTIEELPLCGHSARADMALITETLEGFEIKTDRDTLRRLESQVAIYDRVFEFSTLVVAEVHLRAARVILPHHWGIIVATNSETDRFISVQAARRNQHLCGLSLTEFLWTNELVDVLLDASTGSVRKSWKRKKLRQVVAANVSPNELVCIVAEQMRLRRHWRAA